MTSFNSDDAEPLSANAERDSRVESLFERLTEIEQRLIPTGLHTFGQAPPADNRLDMLQALASFDRPELNIKALPDLISSRLGHTNYESLLKSVNFSDIRIEVDQICRASIEIATEKGSVAAADWLAESHAIDRNESSPVLSLIEEVSFGLNTNNEMIQLTRALRGEYIEPGPGADLVQNPKILPTGRNTHAISPYAIPSTSAFIKARATVDRLLERHVRENGKLPNSIALVLWGLDNIKTQGEGVAQALWLLGVKPVRDSLNRVTAVEVIPLRDLGRPRIDVVMTLSGIFRDLFGSTIGLLDSAVRAVALLDEGDDDNYVRAHVTQQCVQDRCEFDDAILRVFSNAPGNYGTNVNFMVTNSQWDHGAALGDLFVTRKSFAYGRNSRGKSIEGHENAGALRSALQRVEATFQNIDTYEVGITDVDHYFEYLGAVSKAVENIKGELPSIYLSDTLSRGGKVRSLAETVELESRTKTLNPKWYEGMLKHGFRGVAEIESHVTNTFGWSATTGEVDDWIYTEVANTFLLDDEMRSRLAELNAHSARSLASRLIEANSRGLWEADESLIDRLKGIYLELEDRVEGVA